ncbi:MAG: amino acid permease [Candidatus Gastranaerophilales bacterium]|nr:amino acid permease [Candidatus Gastranaerophilales bacterium]
MQIFSDKIKNILINITKTPDTDAMIARSQKTGLKKTLNAFDLVVLGISAIIGAGIFVIIGPAVCGSHGSIGAGPSVIFSIILAALACICPALCYAEFASMIPIAGSGYTYTYATMGEFAAWLMGWILVFAYSIGNITAAVSWTEYLIQLLQGFDNYLPHFITHPPIWLVNNVSSALAKCEKLGLDPDVALPHFMGIPLSINLPAIFIVLVLGFILYKGMKSSARTAATMVVVKVAVILLFIGVGMFYVQPQNWVPFAPAGAKGIILSTFIIFYAYFGFDAISTAAEETKEPQKNIPIGIVASLTICSIFYILVAIVFTGIVPVEKYGEIDALAPIAHSVRLINQGWIAGWLALGSLAGLTSVLLVFQFGTTRVLYAMSRDNFFPQVFKKIHPVNKTPHILVWITTLFVVSGCIFIDANVAAELCIFGTFASFIIVSLGIIILRKTDPDRPRPFKVPFCPWLPIFGIIICLYLIAEAAQSLTASASIFPFWIILGIMLYIFYGYKQNRKVESGEIIVEEEDEAGKEITDAF